MEKCRREFSHLHPCRARLYRRRLLDRDAAHPPHLARNANPEELMADAVVYLRIIFAGLVCTFLYNIYTAALRAAGDSASPLYFLVISSGINILLDLLFVPVFGWGVAGAAVATVLAQGLSALLCYLYTARRIPQLASAPPGSGSGFPAAAHHCRLQPICCTAANLFFHRQTVFAGRCEPSGNRRHRSL